MAKVKINKLPEGFELRNGKIVETMKSGGYITGDQHNYGLVTQPPLLSEGSEIGGIPSMPSVRYSLQPVPRDEANIEAERGETVLTDLNEDGNFELYDILGKRHSGGGTPLNLPPQSFVYSDTAKARLTKAKLAELGIESKKKITPAKVSKHFELNPYIGVLADPNSDKIADATAELMLEKNKQSLSHLAFLQEERKKFKEGVPLASHPYLVSQGQDPIEFSMQVEEINRKEAEDAAIAQLPPEQQQKMLMLRQFMEQAQAQDQQQDQQMGMEPAQGQPMQQQMQPPQGMAQQQMAPQGMMRHGGEPCHGWGKVRGHRSLPKAQPGTETWLEALPAPQGQYRTMDEVNVAQPGLFPQPDQFGEVNMNGMTLDTNQVKELYPYFFDRAKAEATDILKTLPPGWQQPIQSVNPSTYLYDAQINNGNTRTIINSTNPNYTIKDTKIDPWQAKLDLLNTKQKQYGGQLPKAQDGTEKGIDFLNLTDSEIDNYNRTQRRVNRRENQARRHKQKKLNKLGDTFPVVDPGYNDSEYRPVFDADDLSAPEIGENQSDFWLRTTGNPGYSRSNKVWDGTTWSDTPTPPIVENQGVQNISKEEEGILSQADYEKAIRKYINNSINFELPKGGPNGTPLSYSDWTKGAVKGGYEMNPDGSYKLEDGLMIPIDNPALRKEAEDFIFNEYYLPLLDEIGIERLPLDVAGDLIDFHLNSEDPRASLMVAANAITKDKKLELYVGGKLNEAKVKAKWEEKANSVRAVLSDPAFAQRFNNEIRRSRANSNYKGKPASAKQKASWEERGHINRPDYDSTTYTATSPGAPISPTISQQTTSPPVGGSNWLDEYNKYEQYWNAEENKEALDLVYEQYKKRANAVGESPLSRDEYDKLWLRDQKQKRYLNSLPEDQRRKAELDSSRKDGRYEGVNWKYKELMEGMEDGIALNEDEVLHTQLMHQAGTDAQKVVPDLFPNSSFHSEGAPDPSQQYESGYGGPDPRISKADRFFGDNTLGQFHRLTVTPEEAVDPAAATEEATEELQINTPPAERKTIEPADPEFWLQDMIGMGNALSNKYRVNKYYPWAPTLEQPRLEPVFDDPTRRIAAINEQKTISDQARGMYSGPQSLAAFTGRSSGQAMKGIADTVDRVNRYNVDTANKFEGLNANMDFMTQKMNNATRTKLYDDTMLVEQNYDNAMMEADTAIAKQLQNAFTNRANTYNMNTLYDQYNVKPGTGGVIEFANPRDPWPTDPRGQVDRQQQVLDFGQKWVDIFGEEAGMPPAGAFNYAFPSGQQPSQQDPYGLMMQGYPTGAGYGPYNQGINQGYGYAPNYSWPQ